MAEFYKEEQWDPKTGKDIVRVFEVGNPRHIAVFYDLAMAVTYLKFLSKELPEASEA